MNGVPEKIMVRLTNWIGDVVMNLPVVALLRHHFPAAEIVAVCRPWVKDLLSFRQDLFDRVIDFDDKGELKSPAAFWRFCQELRAERFDWALVLTKHVKGALMARLAGIPVRIGIGTPATGLFLNYKTSVNHFPPDRHQSQNYVALLNQVGLSVGPEADCAPKLARDPVLEMEVQSRYLQGLPAPVLAVHAGAAYGTAKRWFPERYGEVCRRFLAVHKGSVVLLGVPSEGAVNRDIAQISVHANLRNLCGETSLRESIAIISQSDVFLSNDSGLMHVAAAFGQSQVAIFGPTDLRATFPLNPKAKTLVHQVDCSPCFKRHCPIGHDCMKGVSVDAVWDALASISFRSSAPAVPD